MEQCESMRECGIVLHTVGCRTLRGTALSAAHCFVSVHPCAVAHRIFVFACAVCSCGVVWCAEPEVFKAMSKVTRGQYFHINNANLLPKLITGVAEHDLVRSAVWHVQSMHRPSYFSLVFLSLCFFFGKRLGEASIPSAAACDSANVRADSFAVPQRRGPVGGAARRAAAAKH
jgi:hypothetical protein